MHWVLAEAILMSTTEYVFVVNYSYIIYKSSVFYIQAAQNGLYSTQHILIQLPIIQ